MCENLPEGMHHLGRRGAGPNLPSQKPVLTGRVRGKNLTVMGKFTSSQKDQEPDSGRVYKSTVYLRRFRWDLFCLMHLVKNTVAVNHTLVYHLGPFCIQIPYRLIAIYAVFKNWAHLVVVSKCPFPTKKKSGILGEMSESRSGTGNV